jgi:hypothetical protein
VPIANQVKKAYLLAQPTIELKSEKSDAGQTLIMPVAAPDANASVVVVEIEGAADVLAASPVLRQASDGSMTLPAAEAITHGGQIKFESGSNRNCIGCWLNPSDWVEWQFDVTKPGKFQATAEIASQGAGSFTVVVGNQKLNAKAPDTGNYGKFQSVALGVIDLAKPGKTSQVRADCTGKRIRGICRKPACAPTVSLVHFGVGNAPFGTSGAETPLAGS